MFKKELRATVRVLESMGHGPRQNYDPRRNIRTHEEGHSRSASRKILVNDELPRSSRFLNERWMLLLLNS